MKIEKMNLEKLLNDNKESITKQSENNENLDNKEFDVRLNDLRDAINEIEAQNIKYPSEKQEFTEEIFENIMKIPFSEFQSYVEGGKIIEDPEIKNFHEHVSGIINDEFNQSYEGNTFRRLVNKPASRMLFAALCLFLKFASPTQANDSNHENKDNFGHKIETTDENERNLHPDIDPTTYKYAAEINESELKESSRINITQSFEVDKAEISEKDAEKIKNETEKFLSKISSANFDKFKDARKIIYVSSDERPTRYGAENKSAAPKLENNINLSLDRYKTGKNVVEEVIKNHDFSNSDLTNEQIEIIKSTSFERNMPEKGYTKIVELNEINPITGKIFSEEEIKDLAKENPTLYKSLNDKCRYVKLDLLVESALQKVNQSDRVLLFIDNSPSTERTMNDMANKLEELGLKENSKGNYPKADLIYYTDDGGEAKNMKNILEAAEDLRLQKTKGSSIERPFAASIEHFKALIETDKKMLKEGGITEDFRTAIFTTDEGLQDVQNIFESAKLAKEAKVKEATIFIYSPNSAPLEKDLFELSGQLENILKAKMELNLLSLEQAKEDELKNINDLIVKANEKIDHKILKRCFGQEALDIKTIKLTIDKKEQSSELQRNSSSDQEKSLLFKLFKSIRNLEKVNNSYLIAKNQSFEDYLAKTQVEIKVFTDNSGKKLNFDVLGSQNIAKAGEKISLSL